jgi:hypothetical protein
MVHTYRDNRVKIQCEFIESKMFDSEVKAALMKVRD